MDTDALIYALNSAGYETKPYPCGDLKCVSTSNGDTLKLADIGAAHGFKLLRVDYTRTVAYWPDALIHA